MAKQITVCPVADLPPGAVTGAGPYAIGNIDGKYFAVTGGVDICAQTWRADRSRTGDWSARGTNPLTTSRTDRWSADPKRSSRRSPASERRSRC